MCGRYALDVEPESLPEWFARQKMRVDRVEHAEKRSEHRYNIGPTSYAPVYYYKNKGEEEKEERDIEYMRWGVVPPWIKSMEEMKKSKYSTFNARYEKLRENRLWRSNLENRCVIPVKGYYEWQKDGKRKVPYYVKRKDGELMFLAGLYHRGVVGEMEMDSYTVITREAPLKMRWLHERMPVVLWPGKGLEEWLCGGDDLEGLLCGDGNGDGEVDLLEWYRVDPLVGDSRRESARFVRKLAEPLGRFFLKRARGEDEGEREGKAVKRE